MVCEIRVNNEIGRKILFMKDFVESNSDFRYMVSLAV